MYCSNWRHRNNIGIWYFRYHPWSIGLPNLFSACIGRLLFTGHLRSIWGLQLGQNICSCGVFGRCAKKEVWCCLGAWFVSSSIDLDKRRASPNQDECHIIPLAVWCSCTQFLYSIALLAYAVCQPSPAPKIKVPHTAARERQTKTFKMPEMTKNNYLKQEVFYYFVTCSFHSYTNTEIINMSVSLCSYQMKSSYWGSFRVGFRSLMALNGFPDGRSAKLC